jgi:serine/threonine-protein kinase
VLGVGGMAIVFLATHRNGNRVAVKVLHRELSLDPGLVARFAREGYVANAIEHRGAVRVLDDDVAEDGSAFLVMELLLGETLEARARRTGGKLPQREVVALAHQLLDVLAAAHAKGVVHRDIKPENLFLTRERELKVLDFGIARLRDDTNSNAPGTQAGLSIGTPAFMPPEQALGRTDQVDARSDVWAAGATLYTLLSGRFVHDVPTSAEMVVRTATQPAPPLRSVAPGVPEALAAVVDRALAFDRDDRFADARAMQEALDQAHRAIYDEPVSAAAVGPVPGGRGVISSGKSDDPWLNETLPVPREEAAQTAAETTKTTAKARPIATATVAVEGAPTATAPSTTTPAAALAAAPAPEATPTPTATTTTPPSTTAALVEAATPGPDTAPRPAPAEAATPAAMPVPPAPPKRRVPATAFVAIAAIGLTAIAGFFATRPTATPVGAAASAQASAGSASTPGCTTNRACQDDAGGKPTICRKDTGVCVALEAPGCHVLATPQSLASDDTIWFGAMYPTSGPSASGYGQPAMEAVDLGRRDFDETIGGLPPVRAGGPRRPIAMIACDDAEDPARVAAHLVNNVGVPAILGFARSKEVLDLAESLFIPKGVLALATNTATMLSTIQHAPGQPRLVWRTTPSAEMMVAPAVALVPLILEPEFRAIPGLMGPDEPLRVAIVRVNNASGLSYADRYISTLVFNGKSVAANGPAFLQAVVPDDGNGKHPAELTNELAKVTAFAPHVVLDAAGGAEFVDAIERAWPKSARFRPRYLIGTLSEVALGHALVRDPEARKRIFGVDTRSDTAVIAKFVIRHNEVFPTTKTTAEESTFAPYDSFYVLAYAAAALGQQPITGVGLANSIRRLLPPGETVEVGPAGIYGGLAALAAGKNIDLEGTATTLDFDIETGDATATFSVYCLAVGGPDGASTHIVETGVHFDGKTGKPTGALRCP